MAMANGVGLPLPVGNPQLLCKPRLLQFKNSSSATPFGCHGLPSFQSSSPNPSPLLAADGNLSIVDTAHNVLREALPVSVFEASSDAHLQAACNLRVRTFHKFRQTYRIEEHWKFLAKLEFEALKERIEGKRQGFGVVSCVIATIFVTDVLALSDRLLSFLKVDGVLEEQLVVGSLDLNKTSKLPDELCGTRPKDNEAQQRRGYLSNVCVAEDFQKRGIGSALIKHTMSLAQLWGISDLYTHVEAKNENARRLYDKTGFVIENEENASEARLMGRSRRLLLWIDLKGS